jgi:isoleucyl-tRNA synthetase
MTTDYSKTVNLPKTSFSMKANLPIREPELIKYWTEKNVYAGICAKNKSNKKFVLHDGPPYANGAIHIGHALNKILKDIIVKYKSMNGFCSPYVPGWDCHGLPIEYQLFKNMGVKNKKHIDRVLFRNKAKEFAMKYVEIQKNEFIRLGVFADWSNPYLTLTPEYESTIIRVFKDLVKAGYIYRQKKPIYWCPQCETALADAEIEYADHESPSVYVRFKIISLPETVNVPVSDSMYVMIWTTTPWTLPANVAVAFHPDHEYSIVSVENKYKIILANPLIDKVMKEIGITDYKIEFTVKGGKFEGIKYQNPLVDRVGTSVLANYVSMEDGVGIVHIAPGHGIEDYQVGLKYKLDIISPVDDRGMFTEDIKEFCGKKVFDANPLINEKLKSDGYLMHEQKISHSYPHCWRCKNPIIFRATEQWFLNVNHDNLRERMIDSIKKVNWIPGYGEKRITGMVETRPDWCLSRQRYWGIPIPAIYCNKCNNVIIDTRIMEKFEQLIKTDSANVWFTKPIEDFLPEPDMKCPHCHANEGFKKEEDILDVWFDSGVSAEAVIKKHPDMDYPCEMYLEGSDQHRGWFQTSLIPAVALNNTAPYKTVLTHGFVVDAEGRNKMSKSLGNVIAPQEIIKKYGAEILRLWASTSDYSEDVRISQEIIDRLIETYRKIRNTIRFLFANIYDYDFVPVNQQNMYDIDRFMLHKLQVLIKDVSDAYDRYEFHTAVYKINNFCVQDLSGFYLDVLKDRMYTYKSDSVDRRCGQTVLFEIADNLIRLIAPFLSFTAEEAYQTLIKDSADKIKNPAESVFLTKFPVYDNTKISDTLYSDWDKIRQVRDKVNAEIEIARKSGTIGSSLETKVTVITNDKQTYDLLSKYIAGTKDTLNMVFITSQTTLTLDDTLSETKIVVEHADGNKCPRCWNWSVETILDEPCARCKKSIV